jgi:hypothetical protein
MSCEAAFSIYCCGDFKGGGKAAFPVLLFVGGLKETLINFDRATKFLAR